MKNNRIGDEEPKIAALSEQYPKDHGTEWAGVGVTTALAILLLIERRLSGDVYWDLTAGRWMWQHHRVLTVNVLSWNHYGARWINLEWLWGIMVYGASHAGPLGLIALSAVGAFFYFWGLKKLSEVFHVDSVMTFLLLAYALLATGPYWDFRPQSWAYAAAVWSFWLMRKLDEPIPPRKRYGLYGALIALTWFWSQFHGSWILLLAWSLVEWVLGPRRLRWFLLMVAAIVVASFGPFGWAGVGHALFLASSPQIANGIQEWLSPSFHSPYFAGTMLIYLFGGALMLRRAGITARHWIYWMGFGMAGLYAVRFFPYLPIGLVMAMEGVHIPARLGWRTRIASFLLGVSALSWAFGTHPVTGNLINGPFVSRQAEPVAAVQYMIRHRMTRHVFNMYSWGGYLAYVGIPDWIDGRTDFWVAVGHSFQAYIQGRTGSVSPVGVVNHSGAVVALVRRNTPFYWSLHQSSWRLVYQDHEAAVFVRPSNT